MARCEMNLIRRNFSLSDKPVHIHGVGPLLAHPFFPGLRAGKGQFSSLCAKAAEPDTRR